MTDRITVVTGFPRCGSSLTMRLLHAGGMDVYAENFKAYEHDDVIGLPDKVDWVPNCFGKAVKVLEPLHFRLPSKLKGQNLEYDFIWLDRNPVEQAKSNAAMINLFTGFQASTAKLKNSYKNDRAKNINLLYSYWNSRVLVLSFEDLILNSQATLMKLAAFTNTDAAKMEGIIIPRGIECQEVRIELSTF